MDSSSKTESLEFTGREAIYMEDDKKVKKDSKKKRDRSNSKPGRSCFYLVDPSVGVLLIHVGVIQQAVAVDNMHLYSGPG